MQSFTQQYVHNNSPLSEHNKITFHSWWTFELLKMVVLVGVEFLSHGVCVMFKFTFPNSLERSFPEELYKFTLLPEYKSFSCSASSLTVCITSLLNFSHAGGCEMASCCGSNLLSPAPFQMLIGHLDGLFYEVAVQVLCPFFHFHFLYWFVWVIYIFWNWLLYWKCKLQIGGLRRQFLPFGNVTFTINQFSHVLESVSGFSTVSTANPFSSTRMF